MAVAIAACGSSSKSAPTSAAPSTGNPVGAPIKVGIICTCSGGGGYGAVLAPGEQVYKAWADSVNASGGINGHPVQLITEDDAGVPGTAISDADTLVSDHVVAIADISLVDQAFATTVQSANIPVVGTLDFDVPFITNPDFYPEGQTTDSSAYAGAATAKAAGAKNLAYIYCAEAPNCAEGIPIFKKAGQQVGVPLVYTAAIAATAPNYTAQCLAAKQQGVQAVGVGEAAPIAIRLASDCAQQGYDPIYVTQGSGFAMSEATATGLNNNAYFAFQNTPFFANVPAVQSADKAISKYFPGLLQNSTGFTGENFYSWASGVLLEHAIQGGGLGASTTPSASEVVAGLNSLKADTLNGLAPALTFTPGKPHLVDCWFTVRVENGAPLLLNNNNTTCETGSAS